MILVLSLSPVQLAQGWERRITFTFQKGKSQSVCQKKYSPLQRFNVGLEKECFLAPGCLLWEKANLLLLWRGLELPVPPAVSEPRHRSAALYQSTVEDKRYGAHAGSTDISSKAEARQIQARNSSTATNTARLAGGSALPHLPRWAGYNLRQGDVRLWCFATHKEWQLHAVAWTSTAALCCG